MEWIGVLGYPTPKEGENVELGIKIFLLIIKCKSSHPSGVGRLEKKLEKNQKTFSKFPVFLGDVLLFVGKMKSKINFVWRWSKIVLVKVQLSFFWVFDPKSTTCTL